MSVSAKHRSRAKVSFREACVAAFQKSGARITKSRLAVIAALSEAQVPLAPRELFTIMSEDKSLGKVDQVTVYRILDALNSLGLVHQVFPSGGFIPCFHHTCCEILHVIVRCGICESIEELDVPQETLAPMLWYLRGEHGFLPDGHFFQINGTCQRCSARK